MKLISETDEHKVYLDSFLGEQVRVFESKETGKFFFSIEDVAEVLGYSSQEEMLKDPEVQRRLKQEHERTGEPVITAAKGKNYIN